MGVVSVIMLPLSFQPPWQCLDLPARGCGAAKLLHCSLLSLLIVVGCLCGAAISALSLCLERTAMPAPGFCPSTLAVVHRPHASAESEMVSLVTLPHPRTGEGVFFALAPASGTLLEATRQATDGRSSFVGDYVLQDGSFLALTPFDPVFLLLPYLDAGERRPQELDSLTYSDTFPLLARLAELRGLEVRLQFVCDVDDSVPGLTFFKLNEAKVNTWLLEKANKLLSNYDSYTLFQSGEQWQSDMTNEEKEEYKRTMVCKIICDVLPAKWHEILKKLMCLNSATVSAASSNKPKVVYADIHIAPPAPTVKKMDATKGGKKAPAKTKAGSVKKPSPKGLPKISSFFAKK